MKTREKKIRQSSLSVAGAIFGSHLALVALLIFAAGIASVLTSPGDAQMTATSSDLRQPAVELPLPWREAVLPKPSAIAAEPVEVARIAEMIPPLDPEVSEGPAIAIPPAAVPPAIVGPDLYRMVFPLAGKQFTLTGSFGDPRSGGRRQHSGEDVMAPKLTPVLAVASGVVTWVRGQVGRNCCDLGIRHDDGWRSRYVHLNNDTPGTDDGQGYGIAPGLVYGARVEAGQVIGWVGDSGNAEHTAPHLHFELRDPAGRAVDPWRSLAAAAGLTPPG